MRRLRQQNAKYRLIRRLFRVHAVLTGCVLFVYVFLGFLWGPSFSWTDFRAKWSSFADDVVVSAIVPPPPSVPVVTAEAVCPVSTLFVSLDWDDDTGATSFDVYRNSVLLVSGLVSSEYDDTSVLASTNYSYVVVAYGPMDPGVASSVAASVTTPSGCLAFLSPTLEIVTVGGTNVSGLGSVSVSDTTPTITGTSNMPTASVEISIVGTTSTYALLSTNGNGYWEWTPTAEIVSGTYTMTVTVTHPLLPLQTASDTITLTILSSEEEGDGDNDSDGGGHKKKKKHPRAIVPTPTYRTSPEVPIPESPAPPSPSEPTKETPGVSPALLVLDVLNSGNWVFQWRTLETSLTFLDPHESYEGSRGEILYSVFGPEDEKVFTISREVTIRVGDVLREAIPVSRHWVSGEYRVVAQLHVGNADFVTEAPFRVVELPLFDLGGGMLITWNDTIRFLGWASLWLFLWLLLLLLLFVREYWMYLHSTVHITEQDFPGRGFFRSEKGKEVRRL